MKDRLITLLGAFIALYIMSRLLFPQAGISHKQISYPTSQNRGKYGLAGLDQWLHKNGVATFSLRKRYGTLAPDPELPHRGNLILIALPLRLEAHAKELQQLRSWVKGGNNVLFLVAMSDWPEWASRSMSHTVGKELETFDLKMNGKQEKPDNKNPSAQKKAIESPLASLTPSKAENKIRYLYPTMQHPLTAGINRVQANWLSSEGIRWHLESLHDDRSTLVLLRDKSNADPALWLSSFGKGKILVTRHSDLFGNVSLGLADNAVLFRDIIHNLLASDGKVVFDDMHQGLSVLYDPNAFFHDPRLHHTLLFMLVFWLIYVMGHTNRFVMPYEKKQALQLLDHVKAVGNLFTRRLHSSAVALRYAHHFFNEIRADYGLAQNGQPVWEELEQRSSVEAHTLERAQTLYRMALAHHKIDLISFVNTLKTIRRELE